MEKIIMFYIFIFRSQNGFPATFTKKQKTGLVSQKIVVWPQFLCLWKAGKMTSIILLEIAFKTAYVGQFGNSWIKKAVQKALKVVFEIGPIK